MRLGRSATRAPSCRSGTSRGGLFPTSRSRRATTVLPPPSGRYEAGRYPAGGPWTQVRGRCPSARTGRLAPCCGLPEPVLPASSPDRCCSICLPEGGARRVVGSGSFLGAIRAGGGREVEDAFWSAQAQRSRRMHAQHAVAELSCETLTAGRRLRASVMASLEVAGVQPRRVDILPVRK